MRRLPLLISVAVLLALLAAAIWYMALRTPTPFLTSPAPGGTAGPAGTGSGTGQASTPAPSPTLFTDASRFFSLTLPDGWKVTESNGPRGVSLSSMSAQSPDFSMHIDESVEGPFTPQYYDQGARFFLNVTRGPRNTAPRNFSQPITIDGVAGWFANLNEPSTTQGQDLQANVEKGGLTYAFDFSYNPDTYPEGERVFQEILSSFMFL